MKTSDDLNRQLAAEAQRVRWQTIRDIRRDLLAEIEAARYDGVRDSLQKAVDRICPARKT